VRDLPHSLDAERSVLSGIMRDNALINRAETPAVDDFYIAAHRAIFGALRTLADAGKPFDAVTLAETLHATGKLDASGGPAYLGDLIDYCGTIVGYPSHCGIVRDLARKRRIVHAALAIAETGCDPETEAAELADRASRDILAAADDQATGEAVPLRDALRAAVRDIERTVARRQSGEAIEDAVETGYYDLDRLIVGIEPGVLYYIGARPSMGKTAFALGLAGHRADKGTPVVIYSLETKRDRLALRMLAAEARVDLMSLRLGTVEDVQWPRIMAAVSRMAQWPLLIDDRRSLTVGQVRASARRLAAQGRCGCVVLDYLTLLAPMDRKAGREQQVAEMSKGLQALAGELNIPVVCLAQLNRGCEQRPDKRPILSDLRDTGQIEQDADVVLFLYRDEVYRPTSEDKGFAEVIVSKQKNGPTGTVRMRWNATCARFDNAAREEFRR
jgi:replicative DNA helicase